MSRYNRKPASSSKSSIASTVPHLARDVIEGDTASTISTVVRSGDIFKPRLAESQGDVAAKQVVLDSQSLRELAREVESRYRDSEVPVPTSTHQKKESVSADTSTSVSSCDELLFDDDVSQVSSSRSSKTNNNSKPLSRQHDDLLLDIVPLIPPSIKKNKKELLAERKKREDEEIERLGRKNRKKVQKCVSMCLVPIMALSLLKRLAETLF